MQRGGVLNARVPGMTQAGIEGSAWPDPIELGRRGPLGQLLGGVAAVLVALAAVGRPRSSGS